MKKVRFMLSASLIALMGFSTLALTSCSKDDDCAVGYTGKDCGTEVRTPMLATYNATDVNDASGSTFTYTATITQGSSAPIINIHNFGDFFGLPDEIVNANVSEDGDNIAFTIHSQKPDNTYTVSGSGEYDASNGSITLHYSLTDSAGVQIINRTGNWTKQ